MKKFKLVSDYKAKGDQPKAIEKLSKGIFDKNKFQTLLGVTGSGKTFTIANVINNIQKPTLVLAHNKTLAAQLFSEFKEFFPDNYVEYFVSYYDYYQPEAYVPQRDLYIEKETDINEDIERFRSSAMQTALTQKHFIIIASVSCIYGIGNPDDYTSLAKTIKKKQIYPMSKLQIHLTDMQYFRSEYDFYSGLYRVRGDTIDIFLVGQEKALRIEYFGDEIENLKLINPVSGEVLQNLEKFTIFPAKQYVTPYERINSVIPTIQKDLIKEKNLFLEQGKELESHRLEQRVNYDLELLQEIGYTTGIENYSRYLEGRKVGTPPSTLIDYMGEDWLLVVDESHMTIPQVRGMYNGDQARKQTLVDYGFRLKAALDNRPLKFNEFNKKLDNVIYVSATPAEYEIKKSQKQVIEQIIRPTGLLDPLTEIRPDRKKSYEKLKKDIKNNNLINQYEFIKNIDPIDQIDDLLIQIQKIKSKKQRVLITTLTKRMAEELTKYLEELQIKVQYLHSDIDTIERVEILRDLRLGKYDVLIGINLLREGIDLPEVSLVVILDADKEGFLRSETSFIQVMGRAARHNEGKVIMYANKITKSMKKAILETERRRNIQLKFNKKHKITPKSIKSKIKTQIQKQKNKNKQIIKISETLENKMKSYEALSPKQKKELIKDLQVEMQIAADSLEFEKAAELRDFISSNT